MQNLWKFTKSHSGRNGFQIPRGLRTHPLNSTHWQLPGPRSGGGLLAYRPNVHRLQRVVPILVLFVLLLATLAFALSPGQATQETGIIANEVSPESLTAGSADWPMPLYDVGRTRANLQELVFSAPFDPAKHWPDCSGASSPRSAPGQTCARHCTTCPSCPG